MKLVLDEKWQVDDGGTMNSKALLSMCVLGAALAEARADTLTAEDTAPAQVTLPKGRFVLDVYLEISLADGAVFKPFSISPDLWYGVTDEITVGLIHSAVGELGFIGGVGTALCLTGSDNGCPKVYNNIGAQARYKLMEGEYSIALDGGLFFDSFDPEVFLKLKIGAVGRWQKDRFAVEGAPALLFGLTNRSVDTPFGSITVNGDALLLPITGMYTVAPKAVIAVQTGLILPFQQTGDTWQLPLSIGFHYLATEHLSLTAAFSLLRLLGGSSGDAFDARSLTIGGSYAL
jgi:hypothetical protein